MREEHEVVVERPVSEVFAYITDVSNLPEWQAGVLETRAEGDAPLRVGSRFTERRRFLGRHIESTIEVTEHEPDRVFSLRVVSGPVPLEVRHTFDQVDGVTRIRSAGRGEPGRLFKMAGPLVARRAKQTFERDFARLKELLEARG